MVIHLKVRCIFDVQPLLRPRIRNLPREQSVLCSVHVFCFFSIIQTEISHITVFYSPIQSIT